MLKRIVLAIGIAGAVLVHATAPLAQSNPRYVQFSPSATKGALYVPDTGPSPTVAILVIHRTSNFLAHIATTEFSKRGFMVLGMNPRSDNNEAAVIFENNALDIRSGVTFLRSQPGITKVLLFGHSGGGPITTFYQAVAENGLSYCQGPQKLYQCPNSLAALPKADGIILADAHPGNSINTLRSLNPAVLDESQPSNIDPALDPFSPANGYNPSGSSNYSQAFIDRYLRAQSDRMNRLITDASNKLMLINSAQYRYPDDDAFVIVKGDSARLSDMDLDVDCCTAAPQKLLKNDGSVVVQPIHSVRPPNPTLAAANRTNAGGTKTLTVRSFLSAQAIRSSEAEHDIDLCSSNNSTDCALPKVSVPLLVGAMGGYLFIRESEIHYNVAQSVDKDFVVVEGAVHGITECTACETTPGQYSNATKNFFDYASAWIRARF